MRVWTPLAAVAVCALAAGATFGAAPLAGDPFPFFAGKEFVNSPEVDAKDFRGRLVLCEVFSTT